MFSGILPPFRPIIDTTNTPYYEVGKFLTSLLEPLTKNQYVVKDSFEAVDRIKDIPKEYFEQGYKYVSFLMWNRYLLVFL